jgi:hypothetical protein
MIDRARLDELLTTVEQVTAEVPRLYQARGPSLLATEQQALQLLRQAAGALAEACVIARVDPATLATLEALHAQTVERLIDSARTCMALEEAELMSEAARSTIH